MQLRHCYPYALNYLLFQRPTKTNQVSQCLPSFFTAMEPKVFKFKVGKLIPLREKRSWPVLKKPQEVEAISLPLK
jgi:hypothetical protein